MTSVPELPVSIGGRYRPVREIGRGAMASVVEAVDERENRPCALKLLRPQVPLTDELVKRFEREARTGLALSDHPSIVRIFDVGVEASTQTLFLAMDLVKGASLAQRVKEGLPLDDGIRIVEQVCRTVAYAHGKGIIHRDLKPENVLLDERGAPRLIDFGLGKAILDLGEAPLTGEGQILGTPAYMAPEQIVDGRACDEKTDVYGLGALLYFVVCRQPPFVGETQQALLEAVMKGLFARPRELDASIDPSLESLLVRAMSRSPADRPRGAAELADQLASWRERAGSARASDRNIGRVVAGKYQIRALLGAGGFGQVYRAYHTELAREVAIKLLPTGVGVDSTARARLLREAEVGLAFVHKHAIQVRDVGADEGDGIYLVMDLARGETLSALLRRAGKLGESETVSIARQILEALGEAHAAGVIHRDLKPDNIMVEQRPDGPFVKILDFGVAKLLQDPSGAPVPAITAVGRTVGTGRYMSPEQASGDPIDGRSDLYSLGVVLHEALTGEPLFKTSSAQQLLFKITMEPPAPLLERAPGVTPPVASAIMKALAKNASERHADAAAFARALDAREAPRTRRRSLAQELSDEAAARAVAATARPERPPATPPTIAEAPPPREQTAAPLAPSHGANRRPVTKVTKVAISLVVATVATLWLLPRLPQHVVLRDDSVHVGVIAGSSREGHVELLLGNGSRIALPYAEIAGRRPPSPAELWSYYSAEPAAPGAYVTGTATTPGEGRGR